LLAGTIDNTLIKPIRKGRVILASGRIAALIEGIIGFIPDDDGGVFDVVLLRWQFLLRMQVFD
jgi:hypothetical protein